MHTVKDVEEILVAALRLPAQERAAVAAVLIGSLEGTEASTEEVDGAWSEEVQQRWVDVEAGRGTPIPWPEARPQILATAHG